MNKQQQNDIIHTWILKIVNYYDQYVHGKIKGLDSYVMDKALIDMNNEKDIPYPIELNSFGKEYSSGSALFHWLEHEDILYGKTDHVHFRWTTDSNQTKIKNSE